MVSHQPCSSASAKASSGTGQQPRCTAHSSATKMSRSHRVKVELDEAELKSRRTAANERERRRTEELNDAFRRLRHVVPSLPSDKMSKIHTLRIASEYIRFLNRLAREHNSPSTSTPGSHPDFSEALSHSSVATLKNSFNLWRGVSLYSAPPPALSSTPVGASASMGSMAESQAYLLRGVSPRPPNLFCAIISYNGHHNHHFSTSDIGGGAL